MQGRNALHLFSAAIAAMFPKIEFSRGCLVIRAKGTPDRRCHFVKGWSVSWPVVSAGRCPI
jgi:hypothetical protein